MYVIWGLSLLSVLGIVGMLYLYQQENGEKTWHTYFRKSYWIIYAVGFIAILLMVFQWFFLCEKSFVWESDGQTQHIVALAYYSEWLKEIVINLIKEHRFSVPMWDMTIGYGSDVITTLNYYVLGDPLNVLCLFVKTENIEQLYGVLVWVRMFLMGISFSAYCRYHKKGRKATLIGSYMYAFAAFALWNGIRHPYFINPMIYLPLMFLGIDKILRKEKPYVFVFSTAVSAMSNFYFCYMLVVFCVIYVIVRYKSEVRKYCIKEICCYLLQLAWYGLVALMLGAIVFLPSAMTVLGTGRMDAENYIPAFFRLDYYEKLLVSFMTGIEMDYSSKPGVAVTGLVSVFLLFSKKGNKSLKIAIVGLVLMFCIPYAGHVLNGFSYVTYRCSFIAPFVLTYTFVKMFSEFVGLSKITGRKMVWIMGIYLVLCLVSEKARSESSFCMIVLLLVCVLLLFVECSKYKVMYITGVMGTITVASIVFVAYYMYSPEHGNYVEQFVDKGCAVANVSAQYAKDTENYFHASDLLRDLADNGQLERTEVYDGNDVTINNAMLQNYYGVSYYYSVNNPYISQFNKEMCLPFRNEFRYKDLDCRSFLEAIQNVKYHLTSSRDEEVQNSTLFRGSALKEANGYGVYEAQETIGFAYAYDTYFNRNEYEMMNVVQKQEMLLKSAMLEDENSIAGMKCDIFEFSSAQKGYAIADMDGSIIQDGNVFDAKKKNATITLEFEGEENCETYVLIEGLDFWSESPWKETSEEEKMLMNAYDKNRLLKESFYYNEPTKTNVTVGADTGKGGKKFSYINSRNNFYNGITDYLCNVGYNKQPVNRVDITFDKAGKYKMDRVSIYCQPVDELTELMKARKVEGGDCFDAGVNSFTGKITLDSEKIVCFSIPYSKGWKAYVDGQEQQLIRVNTMHMALILDEGVHGIRLEYVTPYLKEGIVCTILALVVLSALCLVEKKNLEI